MKKDGIIKLHNSVAECQISLWGGNLLSYRPRKEKHDIFWLGDLNKFDNQQAIRGGIPVCWPRFAEEELNNHLPRHGFARLSMWNLQNVSVDDRQIEAELSLSPEAQYNLNLSARVLITAQEHGAQQERSSIFCFIGVSVTLKKSGTRFTTFSTQRQQYIKLWLICSVCKQEY